VERGLRTRSRLPMLAAPFRKLMTAASDVTTLLDDWSRGDPRALQQLLPLVYAELKAIAARELRHERPDHTLQATALVHEAYLRLSAQRGVDWHDRAHFYGVVSRVMRRILVDHARRHRTIKRGDGAQLVSLDDTTEGELVAAGPSSVLALDGILDRLERVDANLARLVELRAFGGVTIEEAATVLNVSSSTVKREWRLAKAWLSRELGGTLR